MKKIVLLFIICITTSCSLDDEDRIQTFDDFLPIEAIDIPEEFELNKTYEITLTYYRPTNCHGFKNVYFRPDGNSRTVAIVATKYEAEGSTCETLNSEEEATFNLRATQKENYLFKFWRGKDDQGENIYFEIEVPVN